MLDLSKIQTDTYTFSLVLPDGTVRDDVKITVRSDNHPKVKEVARKLLLESEHRRAVAIRRGKKDKDPLTEEELEYLEETGLKRAVSRVESMKGLANEDGKEIGSDEALIGATLKKYNWLLSLVMEEAGDAVNFCS